MESQVLWLVPLPSWWKVEDLPRTEVHLALPLDHQEADWWAR